MKTEQIIYRDLPHDYRGKDTGLFYTPVSTIAKHYLPDVDWDKMLQMSAKKKGVTPEVLQAYWDFKRNIGTAVGTWAHSIKEHEVFSLGVNRRGLKAVRYEMDGYNKYQIQNLQKGFSYPELITSIQRDHMRCAGTSDELSVDKQGYIHIDDTKTDKSIDTSSYYDRKKGCHQMLKYPLDSIMNCNYLLYSIKMSLYMFFTLQSYPEYKAGEITLVHIPLLRNNDGVPIIADNGLPVMLEDQETHINIDYKEFEPHVRNLLNDYYKYTKTKL